MVEWLQSPACHVGGTGSNPVGTANFEYIFIRNIPTLIYRFLPEEGLENDDSKLSTANLCFNVLHIIFTIKCNVLSVSKNKDSLPIQVE